MGLNSNKLWHAEKIQYVKESQQPKMQTSQFACEAMRLSVFFPLTARGAMAEETRVYLSGIPFLMNEEWLRMHLLNSDIRRPWKVVILRKGWYRSKTQWANAFLWYNSKEEAQAVATSLDGLTLPGWWRPFKAELAWTDPNWHWLSGCKYCTNLYVWRIVVNWWIFHGRNIWCHSWHSALASAFWVLSSCGHA